MTRLDLGDVPLADTAERLHQCDHFGIAGQPIEHVFAAALGLDEARAPKDLQMARRVGEAQVGPGREFLDAALALGEMLQQLEPVRDGRAPAPPRQGFVNRLFRSGA